MDVTPPHKDHCARRAPSDPVRSLSHTGRAVTWRQLLLGTAAAATALMSGGWALIDAGDAEVRADIDRHIAAGHADHARIAEMERIFQELTSELKAIRSELRSLTGMHLRHDGGQP